MISDKKLINFEWPPKMPSFKPKVKKQYKHTVTVLSSNVAEFAYDLTFTSEKAARTFKKAVEQSTNKPIVEYERQEVPVSTEEGIIL